MNPIFTASNKGVSRSGSGDELASFAIRVSSVEAQAEYAPPENTPHLPTSLSPEQFQNSRPIDRRAA
jgi:hypothetical protein